MKILHFNPSMSMGGIEAMICGLANQMSKDGHDVSVATIFSPKEDDLFWYKLSAQIKKITLGKRNKGFSLSELWHIYIVIKEGNYDIVNIHGFFYYYFLAILLIHKKVKFFYTIHSDAYQENSYWDLKLIRFKKMAFRRNWVHAITISEESQASFGKLYNVKSQLIHNGIIKPVISKGSSIIDNYRYSQQTKVFIHPARITKAKNQVVLCEVFSQLIAEKEDVVLLIVGSIQDEIIYKTIQSHFCDRIVFLGQRDDVPQLMSNCDAFCLPSIWEGLPVTLLEALSVGCIPICSPVGGIVNVVKNKKNGLLSNSSSKKDYYDAVKDFLSLSEFSISHLKEGCEKSFVPYDMSICSSKYIAYYENNK